MIKCNTCGIIGVWRIEGYTKTLCEPDGKVHRCLSGKPFTYHHLQYEKTDEIDPTIERQYRIEGKTWTLYHYGKVFKVLPMGGKK